MTEATVETERSGRFLLGVLLVLAAFAIFILKPFFTGAVLALVVAYLLQGPQARLVRIVRWRGVAATLLVLAVVALIVAPLVAIAWAIADDALEAIRSVRAAGGLQAAAVAALGRFGVGPDVAATMYADAIARLEQIARASVVPGIQRVGSIAANIGVFLFLLFFLLVEGRAFGDFIRRAMPLPPERREHLLTQVGGRVRALFLGTFLVALVQGVLATAAWWYLGFPAPVFWGFVMTILAVIPAIGPILVMVPAGILAIANGNVWAGGALIVYGLVVVGFSDNLIRPFIIGRGSGVHPAVVLLGTLGGLVVFGTTGFILGPLVLSMIPPVLAEWESLRPGPG